MLFLALLGRRIEEAVGLQPADLDENNVLYIHRVIYNGHVEMLGEDEVQVLPLDAAVHADLVRRLRGLMAKIVPTPTTTPTAYGSRVQVTPPSVSRMEGSASR